MKDYAFYASMVSALGVTPVAALLEAGDELGGSDVRAPQQQPASIPCDKLEVR